MSALIHRIAKWGGPLLRMICRAWTAAVGLAAQFGGWAAGVAIATWHGVARSMMRLGRWSLHAYGVLTKQLRTASTFVAGLAALRKQRLSSIVSEVEHQHHQNNETLVKLRYSWPRRATQFATAHPVWAGSIIVLAYTSVAYLTHLLKPEQFGLRPPDNIADFYRDFQNICIGLLSAQAAFVALVYPMVIALVALLSEQRTMVAGRLSVFFQETEAVATGGSALLLCIVLAIQLPAFSELPITTLLALTMMNCIWFVANVVGIGFFLTRSFNYVRPESRPELVRRYVANVVWQAELRRLIEINRLHGAIEYGYLPKPEPIARMGDDDQAGTLFDRKPIIAVSPYGIGDPAVTIQLRHKRRVADVRLAMLAVVAKAWLRRVTNSCETRPERAGGPSLAFQPSTAMTYDPGELVLARTSADFPLDWAERSLVRLAYQLRAPVSTTTTTTTTFLKEAVAELIALVDAARVHEFEVQMKELISLHAFLFDIAEEPPGDDGTRFNFAQMTGLRPATLGDDWALQYHELLKRVVARLDQEAEFFHTCAYLATHLFSKVSKTGTAATTRSIGRIAMTLFWRLRDWAAAKNATEVGHAGIAFELRGHTGTVYSEAWRTFVGGWESFADQFYGYRFAQADRSWDEFVQRAEPLQTHLRDSALMVGASGLAGDLLGVQWSSDILLHWYERNQRSWDRDPDAATWSLDRSSITASLLAVPWSDIAAQKLSIFEGEHYRPSAVFSVVMLNAWIDSLLVLTCMLIRCAKGVPIGAAAIAASTGNQQFGNGAVTC